MVIGSLEVQSLYPSVDTKKAAKICRDRVIASEIKMEGIDYRWATIYLRLTMSPHEIVDSKMQGIMPRKLSKFGKKPTIRTVNKDEKEERWWWPKPVTFLTPEERKKVMGCVVEQLVKLVFNTHFYEWNGTIYRQVAGGPIGLRSTGSVCRIVMDHWKTEISRMIVKMDQLKAINPVTYESLEVHLLKKYVDDVLVALQGVRPGVRYDKQNKILTWSTEAEEEDKQKTREELTMSLFCELATDVEKCLDFTWDSPERNTNGMLPVLDTQMWVGKEQRTIGVPIEFTGGEEKGCKVGELKNIILYTFYRKPMATDRPILRKSAMPEGIVRSTVCNEFIRRFKNVSRDLPTNHIEQVTETYCQDLKRGGFPEEWIRETLQSAVKGYSKMVRMEIEGKGRVNRDQKTGKIKRLAKKMSKSSWFKSSSSPKEDSQAGKRRLAPKRNQKNIELVLFVPHMPGSDLKKEVQKMEELINGRTKFGRLRIQERVGRSLIESLGNKSPWKTKHCGRQNCQPCQTKEGSCRQKNVTYKLTCQLCLADGKKSVYIGESHRSWWDRAANHERALRTLDEEYATVTHHLEFHPNKSPSFSFKLDKSHKSSLQRQIYEAILIQEEKCDHLLNKRGEWGMNSVPEHTTYDERRAKAGVLKERQQEAENNRGGICRQTDRKQRQWETDKDRQTRFESL